MIRVNSQSGKGGVAYILKAEHKLDLPRRAQIEFSRVIQERTDTEGGEMAADEIWAVFTRRVPRPRRPRSSSTRCTRRRRRARRTQLNVNVYVDGELRALHGEGNGPIAAFVNAINELPLAQENGSDVRVLDYAEHALSSGGDAIAAAYVECAGAATRSTGASAWTPNIVTASLKAVIRRSTAAPVTRGVAAAGQRTAR